MKQSFCRSTDSNSNITIPALTASDTFVFANQAQTLSNKTIGSTGLVFSNATTDIATTGNNNLTVSAGSGSIVLGSATQLNTIALFQLLQRHFVLIIPPMKFHNACQCGGTTLQLAYQSGNTINANDTYGNIALTLASGSSRALTLTNSGTASADLSSTHRPLVHKMQLLSNKMDSIH